MCELLASYRGDDDVQRSRVRIQIFLLKYRIAAKYDAEYKEQRIFKSVISVNSFLLRTSVKS